MSILQIMEQISNKIKELDKKATNPFINKKKEYDPFKSAFNQTYVWIEEEQESDK